MNKIDKPLIVIVISLLIAGVLILASSSLVLSQKKFGFSLYYLTHQLVYGFLIGIPVMLVFSKVSYKFWRRAALPAMIFSLFLMTLTFFPKVGLASGGAQRWILFGPISFQPAEILKLALIIYLATWLDTKREQVKTTFYGLVPFVVIISIVGIFLIMQPDIGTLGIVAITSAILYFLGGGRLTQLANLGLLGALTLLILIQLAPYRINRLTAFFNHQVDPRGISYQINQAFIAIGSGGFSGLGFGQGLQKYNYLPEPMGDSIFAIASEELGFLGSAFIIGLFILFIWRGFKIAKSAPDNFSRLLAGGITSGLGVQAFTNISAISGLIPLTGIPLPFISYGSTTLIMTLTSVGILMNISKHT